MTSPTGQVPRCRYCNRPLKSAESRRLGYGKDCGRKCGLIQPKPRRAARAKVARQLALTSRILDQPPPPVLPGQTAIELDYHQPTLESL
ncbi:DUF6011 domain-containing protein [Streptomyces albogriseolus]